MEVRGGFKMKFGELTEISIFDLLAFTSPDDGGTGGAGGEEPPQGGEEPPQGGEPQGLTLDQVQKFLQENEDGKKWLGSQQDSFFTKSLKTWKENNLNKEIEREISKRFPAETEEQKKIREMQSKLEQMEAENRRKDLLNSASKKAGEVGLPLDVVDFLIADDENSTIANIDKIHNIFNEYVNKGIEERFKQGGGTPAGTGGANNLKLSEYEKARKAGDVKSMLKNKQIKK